MLIKKIIVLVLIVTSLYAFSTKVIADPLEINTSQNIKVYAFEQVLNRWGDEQWFAFNEIIKRESKWTVTGAHYPDTKKSSAWGLCGTLVGTHKDLVKDFKTSPRSQIDWCINYIEDRYNTPKEALAFWNKNNWF